MNSTLKVPLFHIATALILLGLIPGLGWITSLGVAAALIGQGLLVLVLLIYIAGTWSKSITLRVPVQSGAAQAGAFASAPLWMYVGFPVFLYLLDHPYLAGTQAVLNVLYFFMRGDLRRKAAMLVPPGGGTSS